jgi:23S rRNA (uracil1939-C5)-methyltransferase
MVILQYAEPHPGLDELAAGLRAAFPEVVSFYWGLNTKGNDSIYDVPLELVYGSPFLLESMASVVPNRVPLRFQIGPKSFYQTNPDQAEVLYRKTLEMAQLEAGERVYDLYTGTGTIALFLAQTAEYVAGIESVPEAIEAAKENAHFNGFSNAHFEVGDMRRVFNPEFIARHGAPTTVVTDPPRDGMHPKVVEQLIELKAPKLVYVSCNSATQARDLELLQSVYRVDTVQPVDLFPQTHHMESIARLTLR